MGRTFLLPHHGADQVPAAKKTTAKKTAAKPAVAKKTAAPGSWQKHVCGRATKYRDTFPAQAAKLCKLAGQFGATDAELADFFEVSVRSIELWKVIHPEFARAIKMTKEAADARVVQSLFSRAMGYEHDDIDIRAVGYELVKTPIRKRYPPDVAACIFWLKNRMPAEWREKQAEEPADLEKIAAAVRGAVSAANKTTEEDDQ